MKNDRIRQFISLRDSLLREKSELEVRLAQINKALGESQADVSKKSNGPAQNANGRINNPMSLKEAVVRVTTEKSLDKKSILEAIKKLGYRFAAKDPRNSLNVVLYSKGQFKNVNGKFSPAK